MDSVLIDIAEVLLKSLKNDPHHAMMTYGQLSNEIGNEVSARNTATYLGDLSTMCSDNEMPLISVLVVNQRDFMPGSGFFELYKELRGSSNLDKELIFKDELNKVREYENWDEFADLLGIDYDSL